MRLVLATVLVLSLWSIASSRRSQDDRGQGQRNNRGGNRGHNNRGGNRGHNNRGGNRGHNNQGGQGDQRPSVQVQAPSYYNLSRSIGGACSPLDSCRELTELRGTPTWNNRLCDCGPECIRFGSCCADSPFAGKFPVEPGKNEECSQPEYFRTYYTMVSKCDGGFQWPQDVVEKCERKGHYLNGEPLARNMPLTSIGTLTTYRNHYCAVCNYGGNDLVGWEIEVKKMPQSMPQAMRKHINGNSRPYNVKNMVYDIAQKGFVILDNRTGNGYGFKFLFRVPAYLRTQTHKCHPDLRQTCKEEFADQQEGGVNIQELCHAYYSPVKLNSKDKDVTYRNMHCAKCRGFNPGNLVPRKCQRSTKDEDEERSRDGKKQHVIDFNQYGDSDVKHKYVHVPDCARTPEDPSCRQAMCVAASRQPCN